MAQLKDTIVRGNLYVSEDIQIGDISILDALAGIEEGGSIEITQTQSDWEENDEAASSYIKNRPFYVSDNILDTVTSLDQTEISGFTQNDGCYGVTENIGELLIEGAIYDVTWDGIVHRGLDCHEDKTINNGYKCLTIGSENESFTDYPFKITTYDDGTDVCYIIKTDSTAESHIVKVVGNIPEIKKIDKKFLPDDIGSSETMDIVYDEKEQILEFVNKTPLPKDISVDPSLSTRGDAADAKVVGDRLEALEEMLEGGVGQADWNVNDETSAAFVKNRPFYTKDNVETIIVEGIIVDGQSFTQAPHALTFGEMYTVIFDNVTYDNLKCVKIQDMFTAIGAIDAVNGTFTDYPFLVANAEGMTIMMAEDTSVEHTIKVLGQIAEVVQLDEKYISYKPGLKVEGKIYTIDDEEVTAEHGAEVFNGYGFNIATGLYSHAEGMGTIASGEYSHAEGDYTKASGRCSHAEGENTKALSMDSHAEGEDTIASAYWAHAEGYSTEASGQGSHAEGYETIASGQYSHSEGQNTVASGYCSHSEGQSTKASSDYQHVQGKFNIEDTENKYAHIVGNGSFDGTTETRSNAHTLDWEGNAWFAGDITVGVNKDKLLSSAIFTLDGTTLTITTV